MIPNWLSDSANIKLYIKTFYYYGDGDMDTMSHVYLDERLKFVNQLRQELFQCSFPKANSVLRYKPYIWRDEKALLNYVELKFIEFY